MNKIYKDKILSIQKIDILEKDNLFVKLKNIIENNRTKVIYLNFISCKIMNNYNLDDRDDVKRFHDIIYKCDTPFLTVAKYNLEDNSIILSDPSKEIFGLFTFYQDRMIYTASEKNLNLEKYDRNVFSEHYMIDMDFYDLFFHLSKNIREYYICNLHNDYHNFINKKPTYERVKKEDIIKLIDLPKDEKVLKKIR